MSTTLPKDAPTNDTAVPSVEEQAPESEGAVAEDSVDPGSDTKTVSADRFNGLMGRFNRTQNELEQTRAQLAELETRLSERESKEEEPSGMSTDTSSLEARIDQLSEMLVQERLENARAQAIKDHPEAAPFADLIVADSPEDVRSLAQTIAERVKSANANLTPPPGEDASASDEGDASDSTESTEDASASEEDATDAGSNEPPVTGGGAAFSGEASADERVAEAIQKGSFADFLSAKWEKQAVTTGGDLKVG